MKKLFFGLMLALAITACKKDEVIEKPKVFIINPNATVRIEAYVSKVSKINANNSAIEDTIPRAVALDIVKRGFYMEGWNASKNDYLLNMLLMKDTISNVPAFLRQASDIIYDMDGNGHYGIQYEFIDMENIVIRTGDVINAKDTIAYIPNDQMSTARAAILKSFADKDTMAVYTIFQNAFKFKPCTGAEYRKLKAEGKN